MNRHFLLGAAVLMFALGVWHYARTPHVPVIQAEAPHESPMVEVKAADEPAAAPATTPVTAPNPPSAPTELTLEQARVRFAVAINQAAQCLEIQMYPSGDQVNPTLAEWLASARQVLGDPMVNSEDWSVTTIQTPSGEKRHIRTEVDYSDEGPVTQKISYYVDRGDGTADPIPLDPEQAQNPTDTFRAILESDGQVIGREKAQRIYFENGDEIAVTEKNDMVFEIDMSHGGRTFSCRPFNPDPSSCRCR